MQVQKPITEYYVLAAFVLLKLFLHCFLVSPVYELHRDEFLHLDQAGHLALGFQSVPPVTSVLALIIKLLGGSTFVIRTVTAAIGAGTIIFSWLIVKELKGDLYAKVLCTIALFCCAIARLDLLFQPNAFDILSWTAAYYFLLRFVSTGKSRLLYYTAATIAIGFLNKYNIAFLVLGLAAAMGISNLRYVYRDKHFYMAIGLALLLVSPNLIWQYQHHFPVVWHMKELTKTQLENINRLDFFKDQLLYYIGGLPVLIAAFVAFFVYKPFRNIRWIGWSFLITIALFSWFKGKAYYAAGLYPVLMACGSAYISQVLRGGILKYFKLLPPAIAVGIFVFILPFAYPVLAPSEIQKRHEEFGKIGLLRWEDGLNHQLPQDNADMLGWKELAGIVDDAYAKLSDKQGTIVLCDNYGQAGAINYYSRFKHINAVSFSADYMTWMRLDRPVKHVLLVVEADDDDPERKAEQPLFERIDQIGYIHNKMAREYGTKVYLLKDAKADINKRLRSELKQKLHDN